MSAQPDSPVPQRPSSPRRDKVIQPISTDLAPVQYAHAAPAGTYATPTEPTAAGPTEQGQPQTLPEQATSTDTGNPAADLIRHKLDEIFGTEPPAEKEEQEVQHIVRRSKHQEFMFTLSNSGKTEEEVQIAWHAYYNALPEAQKHEVWREFYAAQQQEASTPKPVPVQPHATQAHHQTVTQQMPQHAQTPVGRHPAPRPVPRRTKPATPHLSVPELKAKLLGTVKTRSKISSKHKRRFQSLLFGLSLGSLSVVIMLFSFFNERFIAPFMTPSRSVSATSIIIGPDTQASGPDPKIIIPKINVEVPVIYDINTIDEKVVQQGLERGTVHYFNTADPGQNGNGVIFGHSSSNILNSGKYKFAFVLLRKLEKDDVFYLEKDSKRYAYKIYEKKIVPPSDVSVLYRSDKPATMTLITCDPPGSNVNRLVLVGEQISPDPTANQAAPTEQASEPAQLPSNSQSLWSRIWGD